MSAEDHRSLRVTLADLAPAERRARAYDVSATDVRTVRSTGDPLFGEAYGHLWAEFGTKGEMESREVVAARLERDPRVATGDGLHLLYELMYARDVASGAFAAVRDQTAILSRGEKVSGEPPTVVVHLSHALIAPPFRGSGLAGWLRAWPIATARACAEAVLGSAAGVAITLVAEMEPFDPSDPATTQRLTAYEKAGCHKVDPKVVNYWQPDFRDGATIDADVVRPIPMVLLLRRVGRETELSITGREARQIVSAVYGMYATDFRPADMAVVYDHLTATFPPGDAVVNLVPPTAI